MKKLFLFILLPILFCQEAKQTEKPQTNQATVKATTQKPKMIFFGDSLTAGRGLSSQSLAYPALIQNKLEKDGFSYLVINAGVSGDTTTSGLERLDWVLAKGVDVFILELGANDGMRGIEPALIESNLKKIISKVRAKNPEAKILLVPMYAFPNMGQVYTKKFAEVYPSVSKSEKVPLSQFLLENVAGIKKLNQADGIHPTEEGNRIMADNIYPDIRKILDK
jgi:acyl-CoA thioesterase-1